MTEKDETKTPFAIEAKSCWETYTSETDRTAMRELADRYVTFLTACKTERETVHYVRRALTEAGFTECPDGEFSTDAVFRVMKGKTMFVARRGKKPLREGFRLVGAHCDTPRLDLKQHPLYEDCAVAQLKTHYYGGIRKHQWLARPLALHGVVAKKDGTVVPVTIGEDPADPVFTIPDLLPHLAYRQVEKKLSEAFEAEKLNILIGHSPTDTPDAEATEADKKNGKDPIKTKVLALLHERFGIEEADLYSAELQAVPAGPARLVGLDKALVGSYGQDDRICVFSALCALLAAPQPEHTQIVLFWDKEEIGSEGSTGAKSHFFEYCLEDLIDAWDAGARKSRVFAAGKALSADVHGGDGAGAIPRLAIHPGHGIRDHGDGKTPLARIEDATLHAVFRSHAGHEKPLGPKPPQELFGHVIVKKRQGILVKNNVARTGGQFPDKAGPPAPHGLGALALELGLLEQYRVLPDQAATFFHRLCLEGTEAERHDALKLYYVLGAHIAMLTFEIDRHTPVHHVQLLGSDANRIDPPVFAAIHNGFTGFLDVHRLPCAIEDFTLAEHASAEAGLVGAAVGYGMLGDAERRGLRRPGARCPRTPQREEGRNER